MPATTGALPRWRWTRRPYEVFRATAELLTCGNQPIAADGPAYFLLESRQGWGLFVATVARAYCALGRDD